MPPYRFMSLSRSQSGKHKRRRKGAMCESTMWTLRKQFQFLPTFKGPACIREQVERARTLCPSHYYMERGCVALPTPSPAIRESQCMMMSSMAFKPCFLSKRKSIRLAGENVRLLQQRTVYDKPSGEYTRARRTPDILYRLVQQSGVSNQ